MFGYFLTADDGVGFMVPEFHKCTGIYNGDCVLIFEAGALVAGTGTFTKAATWLQHN